MVKDVKQFRLFCDPSGTRTPDPLIKSQVLSSLPEPTELRDQITESNISFGLFGRGPTLLAYGSPASHGRQVIFLLKIHMTTTSIGMLQMI